MDLDWNAALYSCLFFVLSLFVIFAGNRPAVGLKIVMDDGLETSTGKDLEMLNLPLKKTTKLKVRGIDADGNHDAYLKVIPSWSCSDPSLVSFTPDPDGLGATIAGIAKGAGKLTVTAGDLPTAELDFTVTSGLAVAIEVVEDGGDNP